MSESPKIRVCKAAIAKELAGTDLYHSELFERVRSLTGHGRLVFERALYEMIGSMDVERDRRELRVVYRLTSRGRASWLIEDSA